MTISRQRSLASWSVAAALIGFAGRAAARPFEPHFGVVVGMGLDASRAPDAFRWNLDAPGDSALAVIRAAATTGR